MSQRLALDRALWRLTGSQGGIYIGMRVILCG
jgi:hypothetical protein